MKKNTYSKKIIYSTAAIFCVCLFFINIYIFYLVFSQSNFTFQFPDSKQDFFFASLSSFFLSLFCFRLCFTITNYFNKIFLLTLFCFFFILNLYNIFLQTQQHENWIRVYSFLYLKHHNTSPSLTSPSLASVFIEEPLNLSFVENLNENSQQQLPTVLSTASTTSDFSNLYFIIIVASIIIVLLISLGFLFYSNTLDVSNLDLTLPVSKTTSIVTAKSSLHSATTTAVAAAVATQKVISENSSNPVEVEVEVEVEVPVEVPVPVPVPVDARIIKIFQVCDNDLEVIQLIRSYIQRLKIQDITLAPDEIGFIIQLFIACEFVKPENLTVQELVYQVTDIVSNFPVF